MTPAEMLWAVRDNRDLSSKAKLAWIMLLARGDDCRPSIATIAADCGVSKSTARLAITELTDAGWLKVAATTSAEGDSDTNAYMVIVPGCEGVVR